MPQDLPLSESNTFFAVRRHHVQKYCKTVAGAAFGATLKSKNFRRDEMVCTKTLYNYVDLGLLPIKNIDLPEKLSRNSGTMDVKLMSPVRVRRA